jgi:Ca2+-binding RTX toxin-like protein
VAARAASSVAAIRCGFVAAGLLLAAVAAPQAVAATASVSASTLSFVAADGETNNVTISHTGSTFTLTDAGAVITPGSGCTAEGPNQVSCAFTSTPPPTHVVHINVGDLDDTVSYGTFASADSAFLHTAFLGGLGADRLSCAHPFSFLPLPFCALFGEDGDDVLEGGAVGATLVGGDGSDAIHGGSGLDLLRGEAGVDALNGAGGLDQLFGGTQEDLLEGGPGNDILNGEEGNDVLRGGSGADEISGGSDLIGPGIDTADYSARSASVVVSIDDSLNDGEAGEGDRVQSDVENVTGGSGDDSLTGSSMDNLLNGGPGDDILDGALGGDILVGAGGTGDVADYSDRTTPLTVDLDGLLGDDGQAGEGDTVGADIEGVLGGSAGDLLSGNASDNVLDGGLGGDTLNGLAGSDTVDYSGRTSAVTVDLDGAPGDDGMSGEGDTVGADVEDIWGGSGADTLVGNAGDNLLNGGLGPDTLDGGPGEINGTDVADYSDSATGVEVDLDGVAGDDGTPGEGDSIATDIEDVFGGDGDDKLIGNSGENLLDGGAGDDSLDGGLGSDFLVGGSGISDTVVYSSRSSPVTVDLDGLADDGQSGENDTVGTDVEDVLGGSGNDLLTGNEASNLLAGGPGADSLSGGGGGDLLFGESGADNLDGGAEEDLFNAGADDDRLETRDGTPEGDIFCGDGQDFAVVDADDAPSPDCEGVDTGVGPVAPPAPPPIEPPPPPPPAVAPPPPPPARPRTPPRIVRCLVPNVRGKPLATARALVRRRNCAAGKVSRAYSRKVKKGRVISQRPRAGARLARGAKVKLVVSRGARPKRR